MSFQNEDSRGVEDAASKPASKGGRPKKERPPLEPTCGPDEDFTETIRKHDALVVLAREKYEGMLRSGDAETSKYQVSYNQSLKTSVSLQEEAERRSVFAREHIPSVEARAAMLRLAGLVVERLDALGAECGENCNPKDPVKAISVLSDWARETREKIARGTDTFGGPEA